jgi:type I restriction enzyme S subunit
MVSEWIESAISDICVRVYSGGTPRSTIPAYFTGGTIPWLKTKEVRYERIYSTESKITELGLANSSAKIVPVNSVIVAMYGDGDTAGRVGINKIPLTTNQACCNLVVNPSLADYRFVYYSLRLRYRDLVDLKNGGGQQNLNAQLIKSFTVSLPPLSVQREISDFLESLDDRIESLSKTNITMESIAQAIFKSWFVDFDPVRAKVEGRDPEGMDAETAALFPSTFEDSELGPIPQGWTAGPITNVLSLNPARSLKKKVTSTYLDMAGVPMFGPRATSWIKRDFVSGSKFINGDTLLARITPCLENGKTAYVDFLEQDEVGWGSTEFIVMATKPNVPSQFAYLLARHPEFRQYAIQSMSGTSGRQRVQVDQLAMFKIAIADDSIYRAFGTLVEPLFQRIKFSSEEQKTLADLRDTLLPRLISGKLRVPEAEAMLMGGCHEV